MSGETNSISPEAEAEIMALLDCGKKIAAIKAYREATGCRLADAVDWVENYVGQSTPIRKGVPCPYCGNPLRTAQALQCVHCGMDWHDPTQVVKRGQPDGNRFGLKKDTVYAVELCRKADGTRFIRWREYPSGAYDPGQVHESEPASGRQLLELGLLKCCKTCRLTTGEPFCCDAQGNWTTEQEWLDANDSRLMLHALAGSASERKLRLFAAACFRRLIRLLPAGEQHRAIAWLEQADEHSPAFEFQRRVATVEARYAIPPDNRTEEDDPHYVGLMLYRAINSSSAVGHAVAAANGVADGASERKEQAAILRDIFGNPFRPVTINPDWLTSHVVHLAETIYDERAFDRLSHLAGALAQAGCDNQEILNHCRSEGPHVRGCWVVDLVLGKE